MVVIAANFLFNIVSDCEYQTSQQILIEKAAEALHPGGYLFIDYGYTLRPEEWLESPDDRVIFERTDSLGTVGKMILADNTFDRNTETCRFLRRYELTAAMDNPFLLKPLKQSIFPC